MKLSLGFQHNCFGSSWWNSGATSKAGSLKSSRGGYYTSALHFPYATVQELSLDVILLVDENFFVLKTIEFELKGRDMLLSEQWSMQCSHSAIVPSHIMLQVSLDRDLRQTCTLFALIISPRPRVHPASPNAPPTVEFAHPFYPETCLP